MMAPPEDLVQGEVNIQQTLQHRHKPLDDLVVPTPAEEVSDGDLVEDEVKDEVKELEPDAAQDSPTPEQVPIDFVTLGMFIIGKLHFKKLTLHALLTCTRRY